MGLLTHVRVPAILIPLPSTLLCVFAEYCSSATIMKQGYFIPPLHDAPDWGCCYREESRGEQACTRLYCPLLGSICFQFYNNPTHTVG